MQYLANVLLTDDVFIRSDVLEVFCNENPLPLAASFRFANVSLVLLGPAICLIVQNS